MPQKTDYKKELKEFYNPSKKEVSFVDVPEFQFLMITGDGGPDGKMAKQAIETLYPVAYKIKFMSKFAGKDYGVMPLEGLWWADNMDDFLTGKRQNWKFTYMIMQPEVVDKKLFKQAVDEVVAKKAPALIDLIEFTTFKEGKSAQLMHIGPFADEGPNIQKIHDEIFANDGKLSGKHHEIYLSDFRRANPAKMKTILRQPYK